MEGVRVVFPGKRKVKMERIRIQEALRPREILIENERSLISPGTELALYMGTHTGLKDPDNQWAKYPFYPGYAAAGTVKRVGSESLEFKPGDRVVSESRHESHSIVDVSSQRVYRIADDLSLERATFFKLSAIAIVGVRKAMLALGESVAIVGQGLVGQLAIQFSKLSGAYPVVAIGHHWTRLEIARQAGADYLLNSLETDIGKEIQKIVPAGIAVVMEATGSPSAIIQALRLVRRNGKVVVLGSPRGEAQVDFYTQLFRKGICLIGAHEYTCPLVETSLDPWTLESNQRLALTFLTQGIVQVDSLISHRCSPTEPKDVYENLATRKDEYLGVVFNWAT